MKYCWLFFGFILVKFVASGQTTTSTEKTDSLKVARDRQMEVYKRRRQDYERFYAENPSAATDSVNRAKMQGNLRKGTENLSFYEDNKQPDTLKVIDLSYAGLRELPEFVLKATHLEKLILDYNEISQLPRDLQTLQSLTYLSWRANHLQEFHRVKIGRLQHLERLDLSNNLLDRLPADIRKLDCLIEMNLDENFFIQVPVQRLKRVSSLREVTFNKSHCLTLSHANYQKLDFLEVFRANGAHLKEVDPSFYDLGSLQELYLQENELRELPEGIARMSHLEKLSFYKNRLEQLPSDLYQLPLVVIDLYHNELQVLPPELGRMDKLQILYLAFNRIYSLPETMGEMSGLRELYLHHNRLSVLPDSLSVLQKLEVLRVNDNYLVDFPVQVLSLQNLRDLDVSGNQLQRMISGLDQLSHLELFYFQENPINWQDAGNKQVAMMISRMLDAGVNCVPRIYLEQTD